MHPAPRMTQKRVNPCFQYSPLFGGMAERQIVYEKDI